MPQDPIIEPYIEVVKFDEHQFHKKGRANIWLKLYTEILDPDSRKYLSLDDVTKLAWIHILIIAFRQNNKIPLDPKWLVRRMEIKGKPDLLMLVNLGLVAVHGDNALNLLTACYQPEILDKSREEERRGEKSIVPKGTRHSGDNDAVKTPSTKSRKTVTINFDQFMDAWNEHKPAACPKVDKISPDRKRKIKKVLESVPDISDWIKGIKAVGYNDWNVGKTPGSKWKAHFNWLLQDGKLMEYIEKFNNGPDKAASAGEHFNDTDLSELF